MNHYRIRTMSRIAALILLITGCLLVSSVSAEPRWCNPRVGIPRVVIGAALGRLFGAGFGGGVTGQAVESLWGSRVGPAPNPGPVFRECIADRLGDPSPEPPAWDEPITSSPFTPGENPYLLSDVHLATRDGLRYSFQGAGDYVIAATDTFELQARFVRRSPNSPASIPAAIALQVSDQRIVLGDQADADSRRRLASIDGVSVPFESGSWYELANGGYIHRADRLWRIEIPGQLGLTMEADGSPLEINFYNADSEASVGLLGDGDGNPENDLQLADGTPVDPRNTTTLYGAFLDTWLRVGTASLFESPYDAEQSGSIRPAQILTLQDFDNAARDGAAQACLDAGVPADATLSECTYDMLVLGEAELLADHVAAGPGMSGTIAADLVFATAPIATSAVLAPGDSVSLQLPSLGAGELVEVGEVDRFTLTVATGTRAYLRVDAPCSDTRPPRAALISAEQPLFEFALACDTEIAVPAQADTLAVYYNDGGSGQYAFSVVAPQRQDLGAITLDTLFQGQFDTPGLLAGDILATTGTRVQVSSQPNNACERDWAVVNGDAVRLAEGPQCFPLSSVELTGSAPFTLEIETAGQGDDWGFSVADIESNEATSGDQEPGGTGGPTTVTLAVTDAGVAVSTPIEATVGERLYFESSNSLAGRWTLLAPDGSEVENWFWSQDRFVTATQSGSWLLQFAASDAATGNGSVILYRVPEDPIVDTSLGQSLRLTIDTPGQQPTARFTLQMGQRVYVDRADVSLGRLRLLSPAGDEIVETFLSQEDLLYEATETGLYQLVFDGSQATTGGYDITLFEVADDTSQTLTRGESVLLGITTPGQLATADILLNSNESFTMALTRQGPVTLELHRPDGSVARRNLSRTITYTADVAGIHTFVLRGQQEGIGSIGLSID